MKFIMLINVKMPIVEDWDFHSVNTHTHGDVLLQFNGNSMCNSIFDFLLTKNDVIIVHYHFFYHATFPNLKGPRAPSQNCLKVPESNYWFCNTHAQIINNPMGFTIVL